MWRTAGLHKQLFPLATLFVFEGGVAFADFFPVSWAMSPAEAVALSDNLQQLEKPASHRELYYLGVSGAHSISGVEVQAKFHFEASSGKLQRVVYVRERQEQDFVLYNELRSDLGESVRSETSEISNDKIALIEEWEVRDGDDLVMRVTYRSLGDWISIEYRRP